MRELYIPALPPPNASRRDPSLERPGPNSGRDSVEDLADDFGADATPDPNVDFLINLYV